MTRSELFDTGDTAKHRKKTTPGRSGTTRRFETRAHRCYDGSERLNKEDWNDAKSRAG